MRVTTNELRNVLKRLPPAHKHGPNFINLAIQEPVSIRLYPLKVPPRSDLRVVTFRKSTPPHGNAHLEWELELV